jgi:Bacterial protein of unknown function (DUF899)
VADQGVPACRDLYRVGSTRADGNIAVNAGARHGHGGADPVCNQWFHISSRHATLGCSSKAGVGGDRMSAFARDDDDVFHTYSAYSRGFDGLWPLWQWLDRAPLGRNEGDWSWFHRHDEYPETAGGPS